MTTTAELQEWANDLLKRDVPGEPNRQEMAYALERTMQVKMGMNTSNVNLFFVDQKEAMDSLIHEMEDRPGEFPSLEPLIGPIPNLNLNGIDWAIIGGESGNQARIMEPEWAIDLLNQCRDANIPCFVKEMGTQWAKRQGSKSWKGDDFSKFPEVLQVREYPQYV